jgi:hypothetical protein
MLAHPGPKFLSIPKELEEMKEQLRNKYFGQNSTFSNLFRFT